MLIRKATIEDLPVLLQFEQGIITAERPFDSTLKPDPISYYDLKAFITSTDVQVLVAEIDGEIAGSGYARIKKNPDVYYDFEKYAYLGFMYVLPAYRGMGVNQAIIQAHQRGIFQQHQPLVAEARQGMAPHLRHDQTEEDG